MSAKSSDSKGLAISLFKPLTSYRVIEGFGMLKTLLEDTCLSDFLLLFASEVSDVFFVTTNI